MSIPQELHIRFMQGAIDYDLNLVKGQKSDHSIKINGVSYAVLGDKDKLDIACQILASISLDSIADEADLRAKLSSRGDITFSTQKIDDVSSSTLLPKSKLSFLEKIRKYEKLSKHLARLKFQRDHTKKGKAGRAKKARLNSQITIYEKNLAALKSEICSTPRLHGKYAVGVIEDECIDVSRSEHHAKTEGEKRRFKIKTYYPAKGSNQSGENHFKLFPELREFYRSKNESGLIDQIFTHAQPMSSSIKGESFPILVFSHGFGFYPDSYVEIFEELASQGYIVITMDHPYTSSYTEFADGTSISAISDLSGLEKEKEVTERISDIRYVLQQIQEGGIRNFKRYLGETANVSKVGVFGHSVGGLAAVEACKELPQAIAAVNIDGHLEGYKKRVEKPVMTLLAGNHLVGPPGNSEEERASNKEEWSRIISGWKDFDRINEENAETVVIEGASHADFGIDSLLDSLAGKGMKEDPHRIPQETARQLVDFFNKQFD